MSCYGATHVPPLLARCLHTDARTDPDRKRACVCITSSISYVLHDAYFSLAFAHNSSRADVCENMQLFTEMERRDGFK